MKRLILSTVLLMAACGTGAPTSARFTEIQADSGVNVWTEIEIKAGAFTHPGIVEEIAKLETALQADIASGKVKSGPQVEYVQSLIFVDTASENHRKFGALRFPIAAFKSAQASIEPGAILNAADMVQLAPGTGASQAYCSDSERRNKASSFCSLVDVAE
ncbi:hypothetical protein [Novosphingobium aquae]|uniref:Lipoprotein n=1 Tax=Novosphingobium aquae TaxID=3133435 RepID=A0ABU8S3Y4_9SPHN